MESVELKTPFSVDEFSAAKRARTAHAMNGFCCVHHVDVMNRDANPLLSEAIAGIPTDEGAEADSRVVRFRFPLAIGTKGIDSTQSVMCGIEYDGEVHITSVTLPCKNELFPCFIDRSIKRDDIPFIVNWITQNSALSLSSFNMILGSISFVS